MTIVNVLEAKTNLSRLIAEVEAGGEVIIARNNKPVVRLVLAETGGVTEATLSMSGGMAETALAWQHAPATPRFAGRSAKPQPVQRTPGRLKGIVMWDDRFNDPLPDDELRLWNGEGD